MADDRDARIAQLEAALAVARQREAALDAELSESREQQTATSDILRVIASSPTHRQAVLDTIAMTAMQLVGGTRVALLLREDDHLVRLVSFRNRGEPHQTIGAILPLTERVDVCAAVLEHRTIHHPDRSDPAVLEEFPDTQIREPVANVTVPLMREHDAVGAMSVSRDAAHAYSAREIALLETFADQAVIAIENARLFAELEQRNHDLNEALEQQTATAEVLRVIASSPTDAKRVLDTIVETAERLCDAHSAQIGQLRERDGRLVFCAITGALAEHAKREYGSDYFEHLPGTELSRLSPAGRVFLDRQTVVVADLAEAIETDYPAARDSQVRWGERSLVYVPLLQRGQPIGVLGVARLEVRPFTEREIALLETFADQAVIAIENARLFEELNESNASLREALEQQTATGEVLRVIASSPTDLQSVLNAVVETAARLCEGSRARIQRHGEDGSMPSIAAYGDATPDPATQEAAYRQTGMRSTPMTRRVIAGRALIERRTIHIPDIRQAIETDYPDSRFGYTLFGQRSQVSVPLLRRGEAIGVLSVYRDEQRAFSDSQIALLETFADQAVIAIENARLFGELQARVGELQALGEVGQAVSSSLDLTEVLTTIVINATHLAGADGGIVYEYDEAEDVFEVRAADQLADDLSESLRTARFRLGEGAVGRAAAARAG